MRNSKEYIRETKDQITKMFRLLRSQGFIARQNFSCCNSCGHYAMKYKLLEDNRAKGYIFYHGQDKDSLLETGEVYLAYDSIIAGQAATAAAKKVGLGVEWDGDETNRVRVWGKGPPIPLEELM